MGWGVIEYGVMIWMDQIRGIRICGHKSAKDIPDGAARQQAKRWYMGVLKEDMQIKDMQMDGGRENDAGDREQ